MAASGGKIVFMAVQLYGFHDACIGEKPIVFKFMIPEVPDFDCEPRLSLVLNIELI